jgi:hypothetical protein
VSGATLWGEQTPGPCKSAKVGGGGDRGYYATHAVNRKPAGFVPEPDLALALPSHLVALASRPISQLLRVFFVSVGTFLGDVFRIYKKISLL